LSTRRLSSRLQSVIATARAISLPIRAACSQHHTSSRGTHLPCTPACQPTPRLQTLTSKQIATSSQTTRLTQHQRPQARIPMLQQWRRVAVHRAQDLPTRYHPQRQG
jgi:hypothetical protein